MKKLLGLFSAWPSMLLRLARTLWRQLWSRVLLVGGLALVALALASFIGPILPEAVSGYVSGEATDSLLALIAGAMLTVTTFSLTTMVAVYRNSSSQFTPRVHRLLMQDPTTQNTLAAFVGAFVFALVGIILRDLRIFTDDRALVLFVVTVLVLVYVVWSLIRWILHLQTFGSLMDTTRQIEEMTRTTFEERLETPCLGGHPWLPGSELPEGAETVRATETGYVQHLYQESLNQKARAHGFLVYLDVHPGSFVMEGDIFAHIYDKGDGDDEEKTDSTMTEILLAHVRIGDVRSFDQDPRFGLITMGEVASKALSPGINDPGTAIEVITRCARILTNYRDEADRAKDPRHDRLYLPPLIAEDLMQDAFCALSRDGVAVIEVQQRLQSSLAALLRHDSPSMRDAALKIATQEFQRATQANTFAPDLERLRSSTAQVVLDAVDRDAEDAA